MQHTPDQAPEHSSLRRQLGWRTGTLLVIASMIGTGVFTTTGILLESLDSPTTIIACWAVGGFLALTGALSYAELASALPSNGGEFLFLSRIYHPAVGFVAGAVSLIVGFAAPMAASAIAFSYYIERVFPGAPGTLLAILLIAGLSCLHAWRVDHGSRAQNLFTVGKVGMIIVFIGAGMWLIDDAYPLISNDRLTGSTLTSPDFAISLVLVSFAYTGWNASIYIAGEMQNPQHNLPLSLTVGTVSVTVLYVLLNIVFLAAGPLSELTGIVEVGHVAAVALFGESAARVFSAMIALGLISTIGAYIMTGPRVLEAMGEAYPRLRFLTGRRDQSGPLPAIILQATLALVMLLTASFEALLTYIGFTLSVFALLTIVGVIILRIREPELRRPYKVIAYPLTPLLAIGLLAWMIIHSISANPAVTIAGAATIAMGFILYCVVYQRHPQRD
jgi:APA family basic amino acid/polyamine antiporter